MNEREITLVLDTTAVVAYTQGSIHVGEVLAEVTDGGNLAAVPAACLVEAAAISVNTDRLNILADHPATTVTPDDIRPWRTLAATNARLGRYDATVAAVTALHHDAALLSRSPRLYADTDSGSLVIPIED